MNAAAKRDRDPMVILGPGNNLTANLKRKKADPMSMPSWFRRLLLVVLAIQSLLEHWHDDDDPIEAKTRINMGATGNG